MLNFDNISDVEFEYLCKDIMEAKLKVDLRRFSSGKDGGIDLTDDIFSHNIVVQVKHFRETTQERVLSMLKKEVEKVKSLKPKDYYICISKGLTPVNTKALYTMFSDYMASVKNIITLTEINDFLDKKENIDILKKHYKLWLCSTGILEDMIHNELFVDCETLISEISKKEKYFVKTKAFEESLKCLDENGIVFITGNPGVGKTITSEMLAMHYATQGFSVKYTTNTSDLSYLKKSLSRDKDKKEIVYIDDCFGQVYFQMRENQNKELLSLIKYINLHSNKRLILNSRVTIFREAHSRNPELLESLYEKEYKVFVINMSEISKLEKALILYNHLYLNGVSKEYIQEIKKAKRYRAIVNHKNYNPRLIERICNVAKRNQIPADSYYDYIVDALDNPKDMWNNEYEDRLQQVDRILLSTLYSLTDTYTDKDLLKTCFEQRITHYPGIDNTVDQFSRSLTRLNEAFITIADVQGKEKVSVVNPSVNDFLRARLSEQSAETDDLFASLCHIQQMIQMLSILDFEKWSREVVKAHKVNYYIFDDESQRRAFIVYNITKNNICDSIYQKDVMNYLTHPSGLYYYRKVLESSAPELFTGLLQEELYEYYHVSEFIYEGDLSFYFETAILDEVIDMIIALHKRIPDHRKVEIRDMAVSFIVDAIEAYCDDLNADELDLDVDHALEMSIVQGYDDEEEYDIDDAVDALEREAKEIVFSEIKEKLKVLPPEFIISDEFIMEAYSCPYGIKALVESYLPDFDEDRYREEREITIETAECNIDEIDAIFER